MAKSKGKSVKFIFCLQRFAALLYPMGMSETTPSVNAVGFEKVFVAIAARRTRNEYPAAGENHHQARDLPDWRELACAALERKKLGDTLRRAIEALSAEYRGVLFLRDLKSFNTAETAWILGITVGAVRSRLRRARMQVRDALAAALLLKPSEKNSDPVDFCAPDPLQISCPNEQNSLSLA